MGYQRSELGAGKPSTKHRQRAYSRAAALAPDRAHRNGASDNNGLLIRASHDRQQRTSSHRGVQAMDHLRLPGSAHAGTQAHHHIQGGPDLHPRHHDHEHDQPRQNMYSSNKEVHLHRDEQGYPPWLPGLRSLPLHDIEDFAPQLDWLQGHVVSPLDLAPIEHQRCHTNHGFINANTEANASGPRPRPRPRAPLTHLEAERSGAGLHTWMDWHSTQDLTTSDWMMRAPYRGYGVGRRGGGCSGRVLW